MLKYLAISLVVLLAPRTLPAQVTLSGAMTIGGNPYATDIFGGLLRAPCNTAARQAAGTGIVRASLDMNNAATGWQGYWHELKVAGRWFVCDPMDNAYFSNSFEVPGLNQYQQSSYPPPSYNPPHIPAVPYAALMEKYGYSGAGPMPAASIAAYMNARARRMESFGFNTVGNNLNSGNVEDYYLPFPNQSSADPLASPPMPFFYWARSTGIAVRRIAWAVPGETDDWGYHTIKKLPALLPTLVFGQPQAFPGATTYGIPLVDWFDIFDPQWQCAQAVYDTDDHGPKPSFCPQTNNYSPDFTTADWIGGSISGTTETLMNGSSSGPFSPGTYTVTLASSAGLAQCAAAASPCTVMIDPGLSDGEDAVISNPNAGAGTFQVTTTKTHPQGFSVRSGTDWIFAVTGDDTDYFGGVVDPATNGEGQNVAAHPGWAALVSDPYATTLNFQTDFATYVSTTFAQNVTHSSSAQTVAVASTAGMSPSSTYLDLSKGGSSEEVLGVNQWSVVDSTHISGVFRLDHASGDSIVTVGGTGENSPAVTYFGPSGVSQNFTALTAAIPAGGQCLTVAYTQPFSTVSPDNTVTFDPGMKGYDGSTYEDGPYTVDGVGTSGPSGCNAADNVHITAGVAHAHAISAMLETPLGIDEVNHTKAELQAWLEGSGISGSYGTGAGSYDTLTDGTGYGTGNSGICKLDEAWGLIPSSYNCSTLAGWPLTYSGTITQAVTGSTTAQTVTVSSTTGLLTGEYLDVAPATASREMVYISAIGTGTVTGVFLQSHSSGAAIQAGGYAAWGSAGMGTWKEDSTQDPGRDFLDENGFHTWVNSVVGTPGTYNPYTLSAIGHTTLTSAVAPGTNVTVSVNDVRGIRNGTTVYLDGLNASTREAVTASNVTMATYPAGSFTATVAKSHAAGAMVTSQMYNDLDSFIQHYTDYYVTTFQDTLNAALPGVMGNPYDHLEGSRYAVWAGSGRNAMMFQSALGMPGSLCLSGQLADNEYTESGDSVPILVYYRPDAQNDSMFRDLATTSNTAVTAAGSVTVNLACAESGAYPCNVPSSTTEAYNVTIDPNTPNEEVASCTFSQASGAGNSTMTCQFAKTHSAGFQIWAAIAYPTNPYAMEDWSTPTQADKGQMFYDYWLTGNTAAYCPTKCSAWTAPIVTPPFCPAFGTPSNPPPAAYPKDFGNLAGTGGGAWNFQADNGDYPFIGTAMWEMYPASSDFEDYGLFTADDNAEDGHEDVTSTNCTNWEGFACGGENQNYGDAIDRVAQTNQQIWRNMVGWLQAH